MANEILKQAERMGRLKPLAPDKEPKGKQGHRPYELPRGQQQQQGQNFGQKQFEGFKGSASS